MWFSWVILTLIPFKPDITKVSHICDLLNLNQLVDKPKRVTPTSSTCIDPIFSNILDHHIIIDGVPLTISDHYLVYTVLNFRTKCNPYKTVFTRSLSNFNKSNFIQDLSRSVILKNILNISDIHEAWNTFLEEFNYICNLHAPLLEHRIKVRGNPTPWMSKEIMTLIHKRDKIHKRAVMTKDLYDFDIIYMILYNLYDFGCRYHSLIWVILATSIVCYKYCFKSTQ